MIGLDFHVHAMLSRSIPFDMVGLQMMIAQARRRGLRGFALTEHINAPGYWDTYRKVEERYPYRQGIYYVDNDFYILQGAEISLLHGGDLIAIARRSTIKRISGKLSLGTGHRPSIAELLRLDLDDVLLIGAHPFRPFGGLVKFSSEHLRRLSAIELNGKDFGMEHEVKDLAKTLGLPLVGGSDAHMWPQVGIRSNLLSVDNVTMESIRREVEAGRVDIVNSEDGPEIVQRCNSYKKAIKAALGLESSSKKTRQLILV